MQSNILLICVGVLGLIASRQTEARELVSLKARQDYTNYGGAQTVASKPAVVSKIVDQAEIPESLTVSPLVETKAAVICQVGHTKSQIKGFLNTCKDIVTAKTTVFTTFSTTTDASNAKEVGVQIASHLNVILGRLNTNVANIQKCGIDPSPIKLDLGVSFSDVSSSAFQVVLSLQPIFQIVSDLSLKFSVIDDSCGSILLKVSIALANLVGACSEQVNLFDTRFFRLTRPHMDSFSSIGGNFNAFTGSFI